MLLEAPRLVGARFYGGASCTLATRGAGHFTILSLSTIPERRGCGDATALIRELQSDWEVNSLGLSAMPFGTVGLDLEELVGWYERLGFKITRIAPSGAHDMEWINDSY